MFSALRKIPSIVRSNAVPTRNSYVYVGRPREPLSIVETWGHALVMVAGIVAIPTWILMHITEYRGIKKQ